MAGIAIAIAVPCSLLDGKTPCRTLYRGLLGATLFVWIDPSDDFQDHFAVFLIMSIENQLMMSNAVI